MAGEPDINTSNTIGGGNQYGPVFQGRYFDVTVQAAASAPVALAQLPPTVTGFTGRGDELLMVTNFLDPASAAEAVVVSAVAGLAGVGKTTLAVAAGHAVRERGWYQGGVLFIDLHGYDDRHVEPGQALDAMLRALGVPGEHIPPGTEERCGLYRSVLAQISEPVLVIADNASSEAQVRLLLPGEGPHRAVVTSRHTLAGLDARLLDITVLDTEAGVALLEAALAAARPDDQRVSADRPNAARLAETCGGLPLALQITAALLKADPTLTVSELADELADELVLLQKLRYDDGSGSGSPSVAAAFELSYRQLDETAARVFRLLPVNPGPDLSTAAAAVLADLPTGELRSVLSRLAQAHLIEAAAGAARRWRMHDLLRLYALQRSDACALPDGREQAVDRLLQYYEETAHAATTHLSVPSEIPLSATFTDRDNALTWLDAERPNLIAAVVTAANTGREQISIKLSADLPVYLELRRRFDDLLVICTVCLDATRRLGKRANEAGALNDLGNTLLVVRRFEEAIVVYQDAIAIFQRSMSPVSEPWRSTISASRCEKWADSRRQSPRIKMRRLSSGKPATGTARATRWAISAWR